jgi:hypothetical protein
MPGEGFEPPAFGLQNRCTTTVLTRRAWSHTINRIVFHPLDLERNPGLYAAHDGAIAQLVERLHGMQEVSGSIPLGSTILFFHYLASKVNRLSK